MTQNPFENSEFISLIEAAEYSGLTSDFLRKLAKRGRLEARKFGRDLVIIDLFKGLATPFKSIFQNCVATLY